MKNKGAIEPLLQLREIITANGVSIKTLHAISESVPQEKNKNNKPTNKAVKAEVNLT